jgi:transcriptional regulator with XRE-family HTH domain
MLDSEQRKQIGVRIKQRRLELDLPMQYVADQMGVNKSTVQRYESGTIDYTKKMVLEGLSRVLDVTPEWLLGETDKLDPEVTDALEIRIRDSYQRIQSSFPLKLKTIDADFAKTLLLYLLESFEDLITSFENADERCSNVKRYRRIAVELGLDSEEELKNLLYHREIKHTVNELRDASDVLDRYPSDPGGAFDKLKNLLRYFPAEIWL